MMSSRIVIRYSLVLVFFLSLLYYLTPAQVAPRVSIVFRQSTFNWNDVVPHHLTPPERTVPTTLSHQLPSVQTQFGQQPRFDAKIQAKRRQAVQAAFEKGWNNYKQYAWLHDELAPLSAKGKKTFGGWAATIFDSLDTLWIMGFKADFYEAVEAVITMDWSNTTETACNMFETTIRHLGGLLSAHDLSGEPTLLEKAVELGDMLYLGFDTPSKLPGFWLDFEKARSGSLEAGTHEPSAASGSLSMEFTRLSQLTGNPKYYDAISKVTSLMYESQNSTSLPGMWPTFLNLRDQILNEDNSYTLGALADSLYEYLPKMHALLGGADPTYGEMYIHAANTIQQHLLFRPMTPENADILFSGTVDVGITDKPTLNPESQHLTCFVGGMFALGGRLLSIPEHIEIGARLARGCAWGYQAFSNGILPEIFKLVPCQSLEHCTWDEERWQSYARAATNHAGTPLPRGFRHARDPRYILRPEALESLFVLYRITGAEEFREAAWTMFESIQTATETPYGNAALKDVTVDETPVQQDSMESFWFAETLKYAYLIFSPPEVISLDEWVLNTEAHPFRRPKG